MLLRSFVFFILSFIFMHNAFSLPIDWHGTFGVDTTRIDVYRKTSDAGIVTGGGSQGIAPSASNKNSASFQNYIFRLNPEIIVNDDVTVHGEISTGYARGGFFGDSSAFQANTTTGAPSTSFGNALYFNNLSSGSSNLSLTQFYMELYSDTATYLIGRQPMHWGMGAIFNKGSKTWDRHVTVHDGIHAKLRLGNFNLEPYWAKINSVGDLTNTTDVTEIGATLLYQNKDKDMSFGILFAKREGNPFSTYYGSATTSASLGATDVKITDVYFKKTFGKFTASVEAPLMSGKIGQTFTAGTNTKYKASAFLAETAYEFNPAWKLGFNFGSISGEDSNTDKFGAMYLHPNYQVATLLFRYNMNAISNPNLNIYDSYMVNTRYAKLLLERSKDLWTWKFATIYAMAQETAGASGNAFNHENNVSFTSTVEQKDDLGLELDGGFDYKWNPNVTISGDLAYLFTGKYYEYSNTAAKIPTKNPYLISLRVGVNF
ncbi:MAG: hypothetical protein KBD63_05385 [Bacteriovoracaceae bacterium]|nr:hypothetical protein [Bacteriovoracaceae bacterium]